jgi:hypothetical protein
MSGHKHAEREANGGNWLAHPSCQSYARFFLPATFTRNITTIYSRMYCALCMIYMDTVFSIRELFGFGNSKVFALKKVS